jgi:uncharacterized protein YhaN
MFSVLGVASIAAESHFRELLENGKISAKHVIRLLMGSRDRALNKNIFAIGVASIVVESNFRELLESEKTYAKHDNHF